MPLAQTPRAAFSPAYEHFTGMNEMLNAVNGKTSGAFQNRYHRIAGGIVGGDLLALCECEQGNADRLILRQCLADDLTVPAFTRLVKV